MIKKKALILACIVLIACVAVTGYQFKDKNQLLELKNSLQNPTNSDVNDSNKAANQEQQNNLQENDDDQNTEYKSSKNNIKDSNSQSIAEKYIEEPGAVAGKPKRIKIGGKQTDVVPVLSKGKQVGEIHIDPETGENVGGAGGAP